MKLSSDMKKLALVSTLLAMPVTLVSAAVADPAFEVTPVSAYELPGDLIHSPSNIKWEPYGKNKQAKIVDSEGVPGEMAIQIKVKRKAKNPWDVRMRAPFEQDVKAGDAIDVYFWVRAESYPKGKEAGEIGVALGRNVKPHDTAVDATIYPTSEWKMYKVSGIAGADFPVDESDMGFNIGHLKQTIEFGPFFAVKVEQAAAEGNS